MSTPLPSAARAPHAVPVLAYASLAAAMALVGIYVGLLSRLFLHERIGARTALGIAFAVGGIAVVSLVRHDGDAGGSLAGNLLLVGAVFCEASYVVIGKRLTGQVSARRISALVNLWGLALVTPLGAWQAATYAFSAVPAASWGLLLFYALAASMWTVWLWMTGLRHVPASSAGVFTVMLPVSAAAVGVLLLGERFSAVQAGAYGLALAGVVLATWPARASVSPLP